LVFRFRRSRAITAIPAIFLISVDPQQGFGFPITRSPDHPITRFLSPPQLSIPAIPFFTPGIQSSKPLTVRHSN
jgi:hypothetical protein